MLLIQCLNKKHFFSPEILFVLFTSVWEASIIDFFLIQITADVMLSHAKSKKDKRT